jgi:molybdopterin converting factor small subunit
VRVRVYAPPIADHGAIDERGFVELDDGSTLGDLLKRLRVPFGRVAATFCVVNYEKAGSKRVLADGDTVSFFSLLPGG